MNVAVIFAGGTGQRMNSKTRPKQFLEVHGKPIIVYTIEQFQQHPDIDGIVVVCLDNWIEYCRRLVQKFELTKTSAIVPGGATGQESIRNGLMKAAEIYPGDTVVLIHDGVRPLIRPETISECIDSVKANGSGVTVAPAIETITMCDEGQKIGKIIDRSKCQMAKAPQGFYLGDIVEAHGKAMADGQLNFIDSASLMRHYGYDLYTVEGFAENIKITTPNDYYMFRAILEAKENSQIFGI